MPLSAGIGRGDEKQLSRVMASARRLLCRSYRGARESGDPREFGGELLEMAGQKEMRRREKRKRVSAREMEIAEGRTEQRGRPRQGGSKGRELWVSLASEPVGALNRTNSHALRGHSNRSNALRISPFPSSSSSSSSEHPTTYPNCSLSLSLSSSLVFQRTKPSSTSPSSLQALCNRRDAALL